MKTKEHPNRRKTDIYTTQQQLKRLREIFVRDDHILILIYPDPDSIASAMSLKRLLWRQAHKITIAYVGEIQRLENQVMVELVKAQLVRFSQIDRGGYNKFALVDAQPDHKEVFKYFNFNVIIDHHPIKGKVEGDFVDIRPKYGATATILTQYLRVAKIKPSKPLATAIMYAIKTDTGNFERSATNFDIEQFQYVFGIANHAMLRKIDSSELKIEDLAFYRKAMRNLKITRNRIFVYLGKVPSPDICVHIADFFMRVYSITWSFVCGQYEDTIIVIFRSDGLRKNAGKLASRLFSSIGSAGGHRGAARAEIPVEAIGENGQIERFLKDKLNV